MGGKKQHEQAIAREFFAHTSYKGMECPMQCTRCRVEGLVFVAVSASGKHLYQCQNCMKVVELDPDNMEQKE